MGVNFESICDGIGNNLSGTLLSKMPMSERFYFTKPCKGNGTVSSHEMAGY